MKKIAGAVLLVVLCTGGWYWYQSSGPGHTSTAPAPASAPTLHPDLYPLYPGSVWGDVRSASTTDGVGYRVDAQPVTQVMDIGAVFMPFVSYYEEKLIQAGWVRDMMREAGGPGSGVSVYTKGDAFTTVLYQATFHTKHDNAPSECPCDVQLSLMSGTSTEPTLSDAVRARTYTDAEHSFSIVLPTELTTEESLTQYRVDAEHVYTARGPENPIRGVKFTIPANHTEGTNLSRDSYVSVEYIPTAKTCSTDMFLDGAQKTTHALSEGVVKYAVASSTDAAVGNRYEETVYVRTDTPLCIAVRYMVHYAALENFAPGVVRAFDKEALRTEFDGIRRTLRVSL